MSPLCRVRILRAMNPPLRIRELARALPALLVTLGACDNAPSAVPVVASILVTPDQRTFSALGHTQQLRAAALTANGDSVRGQQFFWFSSAPAVASVDPTGLVTALANGPATITATTDGLAGTADVTVAQVVARIVVQPDSVALVGINAVSPPFTATVYDSNDRTIAAAAVTWSAADTGIAVVGAASAIATARSVGATTIRAASGSAKDSAALTVAAHFYVNAAAGNDANLGTTPAAAFKHISYALSRAAAGNTIKVLPGVYGPVNGDVLPLRGPAGVILVGDEATKGGGPTPTMLLRRRTDPDFSGIVEPPAKAVVAGFTISDSVLPSSSASVYVGSADSVVLRNNRMHSGLNRHIWAFPTNAGLITGNVLADGYIGIRLDCGGPGLRIEHNTITGNDVGILDNCGNADLGGGSAGSAGGNVFSCNDNDVIAQTTATAALMATNNRWDHVPPTLATSFPPTPAGLDVVATNGRTVVTNGATLAPTPCP